MKILCIGDIVSRIGRDMLFKYVDDMKYQKGIDLVIANGENATHGRGLARNAYDELIRAGIDVITMGNHTWDAKEVVDIMRNEGNVIRPANYNKKCPGEGSIVFTAKNGVKVGVVNLIGRTYLDPADSPFDAAEREVAKLKKSTNIIIVDFHAEATSEKLAMAYFLDGKVSAVFGTHTHVATADECILKNGTGFITDIGMTGPIDSVLGVKTELSLRKIREDATVKFELADGPCRIDCVIFTINKATGKALAVKRLSVNENDLKTYGRINK